MSAALREFALAVYPDDGVAAACLLIQDQLGLDVNLVLFAAFVGAVRGQRLTPAAVKTVAAHVQPWQRDVVRPLRGVRQRLRSGPDPAPNPTTDNLREQIKQLEIQAELLELDELGRLALALKAATGDPIDRAATALAVLVASLADREQTAAEQQALVTIAVAAARQTERITCND